MSINDIFQTINARAAAPSTRLNFGSAYSRSSKSAQNRLVSENILRKSLQLVNDLETARGQTPSIKPNTKDDFIAKSVQDILDLRAQLGIQKPARGGLLDKNS